MCWRLMKTLLSSCARFNAAYATSKNTRGNDVETANRLYDMIANICVLILHQCILCKNINHKLSAKRKEAQFIAYYEL